MRRKLGLLWFKKEDGKKTHVELQARLLQLEQILSKKLLKINVTLFGPIKF